MNEQTQQIDDNTTPIVLPKNTTPTIVTGYRMFYSQNRAQEQGFCGYQSPILIYEIDGKQVKTNWKSNTTDCPDFKKIYPDAKFVFEMKEDESQKYIGTQCIGSDGLKRCEQIIISKPDAMNSCIPCWNRMRRQMW